MLITKNNEGKMADGSLWKHNCVMVLRIAVIVLSVVLVAMITVDTLHDISFIADRTYLNVQFYICMVFLADVIVEWILSADKRKYIAGHIFFLLISIPYLNIIDHFHIDLPLEFQYVIRFIPMIRAAYVIGLLSGLTNANWVQSIFATYISILLIVIYSGSLMFYVQEHFVNPDVSSYWMSLWWTVMNITTVGCYIEPITPTGKVLSVILSGGGLILFPVFTVYIADALKAFDSGSGDNG
jgi:Ion channel.